MEINFRPLSLLKRDTYFSGKKIVIKKHNKNKFDTFLFSRSEITKSSYYLTCRVKFLPKTDKSVASFDRGKPEKSLIVNR